MSNLVQIGDKTPAAKRNRAAYAKNIWVVTSGKGGVGKSTIAVNLAVTLARRGYSVGILDADIHGPSVPRLLLVHDEKLSWSDDDRIIPAENFGLKIMSVGMTTPDADTPLAWRSAVATHALIQLLDDVAWGSLDYLLVDLPPGTGDVLLTIAQETAISAALVVTTPQAVATDDVRRTLRMLIEGGVPVAGVIENMSWFQAPDTGLIYRPFGEGGGKMIAQDYGVAFLGEIPLDGALRETSDAGTPLAAVGTEAQRRYFAEIVEKIIGTERCG